MRSLDRAPWNFLFAIICALVCLLPASSFAQEPSASVAAVSEAYDAEVLEQVAALEPDVREQWIAAGQARDAEDDDRAVALYTEILEIHPQFDHALRRRCGIHVRRQEWAAAYDDCKAAHDLEQSDENLVTLALLLAEAPPKIGDQALARTLANDVMQRSGLDFVTVMMACQVGLHLEDTALLKRCSGKLRLLDADAWETQVFSFFAYAMEGKLDNARRSLERARAAGLDDEAYDELDAMLAQAESPLVYYAKKIGWSVLLWIGLALVLVAAGFALSRLTLAEAEGALQNPAASASSRDSRLHKAYAGVLWMCCAYYYLSVPLVLLSVVGIAAAIILVFFYIGYLPIKLMVIVAVVAGASVIAVLKSFFTRPSDEPPGIELDLREAPGLRATLEEVAAKLGTRPVDRVYLEPGADIAVFERGGMLAKLRGKGERCLLLGVAVLEGMDTRAFKAILAHEYGHFSNEDTAGGNLALGVRRSVIHSAVGLAEAGAAGWYNPAWVFLNGFHRVFLRISQGASRLQEVLADRWSARTYGAVAFERGLRHAIAADLRFDAHARATVNEVVNNRSSLRNLYAYAPAEQACEDADIEQRVEKVIDAEPSPYDSHPRPADRFRWARAIAAAPGSDDERGEPVWSLFSDRAAIEERMTVVLRQRVRAQTGIAIPAAADEDDTDA
jgi:Zn-dependent protease with chaperone function